MNPATEIPAALKGRATDTDSFFYQSKYNPVFYREGNRIYARPLTINYTAATPQGTEVPLICNYIRKPVDPIWGYATVNGDPVYNVAATTNFEISEVDEVDLIV